MSDLTKSRLKNLILGIVFIVALVMQFIGQRQDGYPALFLQLLSLVIMVLVLWIYNRRHK